VSGQFTEEDGWQRLHPLSPVARIGRLVPILVLGLVLSATENKSESSKEELTYVVIIGVVSVVFGLVHWLVTRWKIDGDTLRIETGLIRRDSRRLPLARIQAIDIVRPLMARILGISELRIRLAGSGGTDGRLAYLPEQEAIALRDRLLSGAALADTSAAPTAVAVDEHPMASVPTGRLAGSVLLSGVSMILLAILVTLAVVDDLSPKAAAAVLGVSAIYLLSFVSVLWRRLSNGYHFVAVETPDGVRIRRGLLATVSETVPLGRIQAVRQIEPLLWRPLGWCRLEVDIAGSSGRNQRGEGSGVSRKALLPVGSHQDARHLLDRLIGGSAPAMTPPPLRARGKAPLSYHFLAAGHDEARVVCVTGRLTKVTAWVPLEKAQSIRRVQGPLQRRLGLASVHVDAAGKRAGAEFRDRSMEEADQLVEALSNLSRTARHRQSKQVAAVAAAKRSVTAAPTVAAAPVVPAAIPSGWYADPSGRHELRYWRDGRWTEHVSNHGVTAVDQP
jgi:putative membrane protein